MLSLALIVKNEEKNLARCLDSIAGLWDELVIVDTGSTDKTVEIAKRYTDNIFNFTWVKHFAKARNFAFSKCSHPWVMWLDADDILKPEDVKNIRNEFLKLESSDQIDYILINYHYWVDPPTATGIPKATQLRERIIRKSKAKWIGRCHEHIVVDWGRSYSLQNAAVWHMRDEEDRKADGRRNLELMILEAEDNPSQRNYFYLGNEYVGVGDHKKAVDCYNKAYKQQENADTTFQAAYKIAESQRELGNSDEALVWYTTAIRHDPSYREPLLGIASIYMDKKEYKKAAFWFESSINIPEPKNPVMVVIKDNYTWVPYNYLSQAYFYLGEFKKSIAASEKLYEYTRQNSILNDIALSYKSLKATYKRPTGITRLNLGSGGKTIPGFINCDLFPQPGVDEIFSLDEIPYADRSVDEISSEHALEHLPRLQGEKAIKEWSRVLKRGGKLSLKVPDLEECCRQFLAQPQYQDIWYMHTLYGVQDFRNDKTAAFQDKVNYGQIHYTGFTEKRLRQLLIETGFIIDKLYKYDGYDTPSLAVEAHIANLQNAKKIAFINNTLIPKYLSYGDYWEDALRASGHHVDVYRYENISSLAPDYDFYFFIEAGGRYDTTAIPDHARPRILYSQENPAELELKCFDIVATPNLEKVSAWVSVVGRAIYLPNERHVEQISELINLDPKNLITQPISIQPKMTDIIIPSYKSLEYLKQTINSVKKNTNNYNLIVVNSGNSDDVRQYLKNEAGITLKDSLERLSFSQAVNRGLQSTQNDVVILNNDTIVGKNWLEALQNSPFDITNPFSNCDAGWIHQHYPVVGGKKLHPNMTLNDVDIESLLQFESPVKDIIARNQPGQEWVAFYATYIKRSVINKTGLLDETFVNGGEDWDYCRRAVKFGFKCGHAMGSWVFHFGGKTRKVSEEDNYQQHHKEDDFNNSYMEYKAKKTIAIYCGMAWERWTIKNINTTGIGGSETCAALLAKEFSRLGFRSILIGDCSGLEGTIDGVEYIDYRNYNKFKESNYVDYFIASRTTSPLGHHIKNGKNFVWVHDIWLPEITYQDSVNKFVCLSPWHVNFFSEHHKLSKDKIYIQSNGLDLTRYENAKVERDPYKLIYSSSPDRGLLNLLRQMPILKKRFPKLSLHIFYGFDNWAKAIKQRNSNDEIKHMELILELMKQEGVVNRGRISQMELAQEQMSSALWVYPTWFTETFCITAIECMYAGAVPVVVPLAALETTVPGNCGIKESDVNKFTDIITNVIEDYKKLEDYRKAGRKFVGENFSWETVAHNWLNMFDKV